ncbi:sensor histidine kinase [bacterium 1XD8-76]|nr:sensor histidine kinase [bacterium 1XD8-76]
MSLKKAFFLLSLWGILTALLLCLLIWTVCEGKRREYPSGGVTILPDGTMTELEKPTPEEQRMLEILTAVPLAAGLLLPVAGLGMAGLLFYRWKLKEPIALLREGAENIRRHDLDFSFPEAGADELGQVCAAFESMRAELQRTNRELWRQNEERRRLNAAFAHDLRNPVTVLKGTVRLLRENREDPQALERLDIYTARIEQYIEAMSGIQKLEQMPVKEKRLPLSVLLGELEETARLFCPSLEVEVSAGEVSCGKTSGEKASGGRIDSPGRREVLLDHGIFLTVAENLIDNASRFAENRVEITLSAQEDMLMLTVEDDGAGFPDNVLKDGPKPFGRTGLENRHFGMGLYGSGLLCEKHGGSLHLENRPGGGAAVSAVFSGKYYTDS